MKKILMCFVLCVITLTACVSPALQDLATGAPMITESAPEPSEYAKPTMRPTQEPTATPMPTETITPEPTDTPEPEISLAPSVDLSKVFLPTKDNPGSLYGIEIGMSEEEVEAILGPPRNGEYYNDFLSVSFWTFIVDGKEHVDMITVTAPVNDGPCGITVGDTIEEVFDKLGYPKEYLNMIPDDWFFFLYEIEQEYNTESAHLEYHDNQIVEIVIDYIGDYFNIYFEDGIVERYAIGCYIN